MKRKQSIVSCTSLFVLVIFALPGQIRASVTHWQADLGNWSDSLNWDAGEPDSAVYAILDNGGTAEITLSGEQCLGFTATYGTVNMSSGSLITAGCLDIGYAGTADFIQSGGALTLNDQMFIGISQGFGRYSISGGTLEVAEDRDVFVGMPDPEFWGTGQFTVTGAQSSIEIGGSFELSTLSTLNSQINQQGISAINVSGWAAMDGSWSVVALGDVPLGRFDVLTADTIDASFKAVYLPDADWNWGVDYGTAGAPDVLWIEHVPEPTTFLLLATGGLFLRKRGKS